MRIPLLTYHHRVYLFRGCMELFCPCIIYDSHAAPRVREFVHSDEEGDVLTHALSHEYSCPEWKLALRHIFLVYRNDAGKYTGIFA